VPPIQKIGEVFNRGWGVGIRERLTPVGLRGLPRLLQECRIKKKRQKKKKQRAQPGGNRGGGMRGHSGNIPTPMKLGRQDGPEEGGTVWTSDEKGSWLGRREKTKQKN